MKIYFSIIILLLSSLKSFTQNNRNGIVSGIVQTNENKSAQGITVILMNSKDSSIVKTSITNNNGEFEFRNIAEKKYFIEVDAIGYNKFITKPFNVATIVPIVKIQPILLSIASQNLDAVTVTSTTQKPFVENKIDKMVVNVEASATNTGLSAMEILEKSPGVTIDNNDNISLKGKQGVVILIDGKPSYLSGTDLSNFLRNLPANQLDQIEIMTQPSAKYDASGNAGIINIKTKKNKNNGFNGSINSSAIFAKYFKNTNGLTFNWRQNKFNIFGNYGFSDWVGFSDRDIYRAFRADQYTLFNRYFNQGSFSKYKNYTHNFKLGTDYYASKNTTLGIVISGFTEKDISNTSATTNIYDSLNNFVQYNTATTNDKEKFNNLGFNFNLRQLTDKKGGELTADADYVFYTNNHQQSSNNYLYNNNNNLIEAPYLLSGNLPMRIDIYTLKADYSKPLAKNTKLEAGFKTSYVKTDNDANYTMLDSTTQTWQPDTTRSNHFVYKENINAAYINLSKQIKKFSVQLGLRAEQTIANGKQSVHDNSFNRNYIQFFPTAYFSYAKNENNTFSLSYGRRIQRPDYEDLNPFQYILDKYTYQQGNPDLQPQFSHNIELSYNYKNELHISANYSITTDIINDVLKSQQDGANYITFQTKSNIATNENEGLAINYSKRLTKWWSTNIFFNTFNNHYKGIVNQQNINVNSFAFSTNMNNQFNFGKGWSGELSGFYQSQQLVSSIIISDPRGFFSLGGSKQLLKNKASIRVNVRDPFYLMRFHGTSTMNTFFIDVANKWDNRRLIITFTYKFGKPLKQASSGNHSASDDEQSRVKSNSQN